MNEQHDDFNEVLDIPPENYHQAPNVYVDEFILYLTSDEYKTLAYMIRNVTGRRTWKTHHIAISVIVEGRQLDKTFCVGLGLSEATVRKCLQSLTDFGFIVPIGKPTQKGQNWGIGRKIKLGELRKRYQEKLDRDIARIQKARENIGKGEQTDNPFCPTEPLLSDRTSPLLSDRTPDVLSDRTHRKKEEIQKKEELLAPAIADRAGTHSHTPSLADEADDKAMFKNSARAGNALPASKPMREAQTPSPSLKQKPSTAEDTTPPIPQVAPPPLTPAPEMTETPVNLTGIDGNAPAKKTESAAQAAQRIKVESLVACGFAEPTTTRGWSNFKGVIKTLTEAGITAEMYADFVKWVRAQASSQSGWTVTINSIAEKMRPETYMEYRAKNAIRRDSTGAQVYPSVNPSKRAYSRETDPTYAHLYANPEQVKQAK